MANSREEKQASGALPYKEYIESLADAKHAQVELPTVVLDYINKGQYSKLESAIMIHLDHLDGIKSSVEIDEAKYPPTGIAFVRDATEAKPLNKRLPPDSPAIEANNMLLRALSTARGIDHVLQHKTKKNGDVYNTARNALRKKLLALTSTVIALQKNPRAETNAISLLQKKFNANLYKILCTTRLNTGIENPKDIITLLAHYRDLASILDPAKCMVTTLKDTQKDRDGNNIEIVLTEIAHPITKKTALQKEQINVMNTVNSSDRNNFHAAKNEAFQEANAAFCELLKKDDRRLPAQTRKTIGPSLKNGYVIHNKLEFRVTGTQQKMTDITEYWGLRSGAMAYVGKHESDNKVAQYTRENLLQLHAAAKELTHREDNIHITMLLTNSSRENQDTVIKHTEKESKKLGFDWSYVPINPEGLLDKLDISPLINQTAIEHKQEPPNNSKDLTFKDIFRGTELISEGKRIRIQKAGDVIKHAIYASNTIGYTGCASGQDRTGTALEVATQLWTENAYKERGIPIGRQTIEMIRAVGCHNALLASLAAPGSPGMKDDSKPGKYFSSEVNEHFYRASAKTNKEKYGTPIEEKSATILLNPATKEILAALSKDVLNQLSDPMQENDILDALDTWRIKAIEFQEQQGSTKKSGGHKLFDDKKEKILANALADLTAIQNLDIPVAETIMHLKNSITSLRNANPTITNDIFDQLEQIATEGTKRYPYRQPEHKRP